MTGVVIYQQNAGSVILQHESHKLKGSTLGWVQVRDLPTIFLLKAGGGLGADLFASLVDKVFIDVGVARPFVLQVGGARGPVANSHPPSFMHIWISQIQAPARRLSIRSSLIMARGLSL